MNKSHPADLGMRLGPGPGPDPRLFPTVYSPPPVSQRDLESSVSQTNGGSQGSQDAVRPSVRPSVQIDEA